MYIFAHCMHSILPVVAGPLVRYLTGKRKVANKRKEKKVHCYAQFWAVFGCIASWLLTFTLGQGWIKVPTSGRGSAIRPREVGDEERGRGRGRDSPSPFLGSGSLSNLTKEVDDRH